MGLMDDAKNLANSAKDDPAGALDKAKDMADHVLDKVEDANLVDKIPGDTDNQLLEKAREIIPDNDQAE